MKTILTVSALLMAIAGAWGVKDFYSDVKSGTLQDYKKNRLTEGNAYVKGKAAARPAYAGKSSARLSEVPLPPLPVETSFFLDPGEFSRGEPYLPEELANFPLFPDTVSLTAGADSARLYNDTTNLAADAQK